jgi:hypothetical protein
MIDLNFQDLEDKWNLKSLISPIECNSGWFGLLEQFLAELSPKQRSKDVHQIKEKYGTLRIYGSFKVEAIAKKYEALSAQTCEMTGEPGKLHKKGGWYQTLSRDQAALLGFQEI